MSVDYEDLLKRLRAATKHLEEAQALDAKGGPRRTQWAAEKRVNAMLWAWEVKNKLQEDQLERHK